MTKIIAVTACPSGVAHTYMAAEALESAAKAKGWEVKVETQGSIGLENELTAEDVASADMVILTKDIGIKLSLFRILCKYLFSEVAVQAVTELDNK
ncbi:PTS fructose-like transporter subunit IIB, partial [Escherichia coli]|uniref:PTS fructose-like transporter subunit IIB n=1 Tax=Escherichia coli TaxID=562 RepID=UPI001FCE3C07